MLEEKSTLLKDRKWLERKYIYEKLSHRKIADSINAPPSAVYNALKQLDIPMRRRSDRSANYPKYPLLHEKEWLEKKYLDEKLSTCTIAKIVGCKSSTTVNNALVSLNIEKRTLCETRKRQKIPTHHTKPELIFEEICKKYALPFKYTGDGCFWIQSINPDFVEVNGKKIAVEIFSYWHDPLKRHCKVRYSATYEGRKRILKEYGWKLIVLWESDLLREDAEQFVLSSLKKQKVI